MASGILEVLLIGAKGISDEDFFGDSDPYVLMEYRNQEHKSGVATGQGRSPVWNQKFSFRAEYPGRDGKHKLILKIMDKDTFSADDFLGQATVYLEDFLALGVEKGTSEISPYKYRIVQADQTYRGEIEIGITFTRRMQNDDSDIQDFGGWKQSDY